MWSLFDRQDYIQCTLKGSILLLDVHGALTCAFR